MKSAPAGDVEPPATAPAAGAAVAARWGELVLLFVVAPSVLATFMRGWMVFPAIWLLGLIAAMRLLRDRGFDRGELVGRAGLRRAWVGIALRVVTAAMLMAIALAVYERTWMFALLRERPGLLAIILVGYPVLSVYPQEMAFRTYFRRRYRGLVRSEGVYVAINAAAFGYAHIILRTGANTAVTMGLCFVAGALLAWAYERHRSTMAAWLEHTLYGCAAFIIGWGPVLYGGGFG